MSNLKEIKAKYSLAEIIKKIQWDGARKLFGSNLIAKP